MNERLEVIPDGSVAVEGGEIVDIGESEDIKDKYSADKEIDAEGKVVTPGMICTHTHMPYVLGHNMPVDTSELKTFWDMLEKMGWEWLEDLQTKDSVYASTKFAAIKMIKNGVTTVCEMVQAPNDLPGPLESSCKAIREVGLRAQVGYEVTERISEDNAEKGIEENLNLIDKIESENWDKISARFGVHTAYTNSPERLKKVRELASEHETGIQIHIAEIPPDFLVEKYGKTAPKVLDDLDFLGPDVLAAHCIHLSDEDLDILAKKDVKVSHTPMSNAMGGGGVARVPDMLDKGMTVSVGHDCFFTLDMPEYLRFAQLIHKAHRANPGVVPLPQALQLVTGMGARALNVEDEIGSIEKGKRADLIIIDPTSPTPVNEQSVLSYMLNDMIGQEVQTSIIGGQVIMENGEILTADEKESMEECRKEARILWRKNDIEV